MKIPMGRHSYNYGISVIGHESILAGSSIGNFCSISDNLQLIAKGKHMVDWVTTYPFRVKWNMDVPLNELSPTYPIIIENDVWIASNVKILQGVVIGNGSVIATESFVTSDVQPYSIVGGNPAKVLRYRFTKRQIEQLLQIEWWYWDDEKIRNFVPLLVSNNVDEFIEKVACL
jgi:acetyltransferase-like isoleucine patch superfamily enzyme